MGTLTGANTVITLTQPTVFPDGPQQLQGFAADDVFDVDSIKSVETLMGVDGVLSAGFVFVETPMNITLQADSPSNHFFEALQVQTQAARLTYPINGIILLPDIESKFILTQGYLTGYPPIPTAKKLLQPRRYQITWGKIAPAPI